MKCITPDVFVGLSIPQTPSEGRKSTMNGMRLVHGVGHVCVDRECVYEVRFKISYGYQEVNSGKADLN